MGEREGRVRLPFDVTDPRLGAAAWSRLAEPGDPAAGVLVGRLGAGEALAWVASGASDLPSALASAPVDAASWARARERWAPRLAALDPRRELASAALCGARVVVPGDAEWPDGLTDLGEAAPFCLWVRGGSLLPLARSAAVVGARAATHYGVHVAAELAVGLTERSVLVVSGGAYGVDAAAHRGALAAGGDTVAVLAGGVDRPYPAGNSSLLSEIAERGSLVAEVAPGSAPTRSRFLMRNRVIAAMTRGVVVVEAAWRSGALSTATHAARLLRPVGAVPGPVTSAVSAGCHRLLRDGVAVCVTDAAECAELVGGIGTDLAPEHDDTSARVGARGLAEREARVLEAIPLRSGSDVPRLARTAGLAEADVRAGLAFLELAGLVTSRGSTWRRAGG